MKLNGPVFMEGDPNEFVDGLENFGQELNNVKDMSRFKNELEMQ